MALTKKHNLPIDYDAIRQRAIDLGFTERDIPRTHQKTWRGTDIYVEMQDHIIDNTDPKDFMIVKLDPIQTTFEGVRVEPGDVLVDGEGRVLKFVAA
jgi:hypothetical protein